MPIDISRWRDLDLDFIAHPTTGDVTTKNGVEAVKRAVRNLVLLARYDKPFNPDIQCGIRQMLFEPLSPITAMHLRQNIIVALKQFEPRIDLFEVQVLADADKNAFDIAIYFRVKNVQDPVVVNLTLERLR
jgi:phage baseplate assembly protein W